jgi:hypothetical protein
MKWRALLLVAAIFFPFSSGLADDTKQDDIEFHAAAYSFPCRDKTPQEFAEANPDRKILEVSVRISAIFNLAEDQVNRLEYRLKMPEAFEICDYLPKTTIGSEIVGQIGIGQQDASKSMTVISVDAGAKAGFNIPYLTGAEGQTKSEAKNEAGKEIGSSVQMNLMPPKQLITAASTQDGGRTLHFKLQQFNQVTLQGDKDFAFLAAVPKDWKGDCFKLECTAFLKDSRSIAAHRTLMIGLYKIGELATKKQVEARAKAFVVSAAGEQRPLNEAKSQKEATSPVDTNDLSIYVGKYTYDNWTIEFFKDGTYIGTWTYIFGTKNLEGKWSVRNSVLRVANMFAGSLKGQADGYDLEAKIVSFDPNKKRREIKLDNKRAFVEIK